MVWTGPLRPLVPRMEAKPGERWIVTPADIYWGSLLVFRAGDPVPESWLARLAPTEAERRQAIVTIRMILARACAEGRATLYDIEAKAIEREQAKLKTPRTVEEIEEGHTKWVRQRLGEAWDVDPEWRVWTPAQMRWLVDEWNRGQAEVDAGRRALPPRRNPFAALVAAARWLLADAHPVVRVLVFLACLGAFSFMIGFW
jgi:hypothetical protein